VRPEEPGAQPAVCGVGAVGRCRARGSRRRRSRMNGYREAKMRMCAGQPDAGRSRTVAKRGRKRAQPARWSRSRSVALESHCCEPAAGGAAGPRGRLAAVARARTSCCSHAAGERAVVEDTQRGALRGREGAAVARAGRACSAACALGRQVRRWRCGRPARAGRRRLPRGDWARAADAWR
jgi:hypothetical protein